MEQYDRIRPSYPADILKQLHDALPAPAHERGLKILEPGAGTGIFTRLLVAPPDEGYPSWNISTLVGVEPSAGMRDAWEKGFERLGPVNGGGERKIKIVEGTFDDFSKASDCGMEEASVDLVVIAQAWHWCPDHEAAFVSLPS